MTEEKKTEWNWNSFWAGIYVATLLFGILILII